MATTAALAVSLILSLQPVIENGIQDPISVVFDKSHPQQMFVVEQRGKILVFENQKPHKKPFLDIQKRVEFGGEKGLLGLALHPDFSKNGRYFINYTAKTPKLTTIVSERNRKDPSEKILISFSQPYSNHNGGHLAFGPDGKLYVGTGDGGSAGDPLNQGQNKQSFLGKILRLDVDNDPFPVTNPTNLIFAWGLRNPWRFSFDRKTGALFAGDVGQNRWEEIDLVKAGKNYGWKTMEGFHCFDPKKNCDRAGLELPLVEYGRELGGSVTGGYVYRGEKMPELKGTYLYGDFMSGNIWGLYYDQESKKVIRNEILLKSKKAISSFAEDPSGELYVIDYAGKVFKIVSGSS